jgi:ribosome-associated translation inhibitor RaiA
MQILLQADKIIEGGQPMAEHLQTVVKGALGRFGERVTRVEAHLCDVDGRAKLGVDSIRCMLEARLIDLDAVVVTEHGPNPHLAIDGAVRKLKRAVGAAIGKRDPRRQQARSDAGLPTEQETAQPG